jgi:hypothetical protein
MATDPRRFAADPISGLAGVARDTQRDLNDVESTLLARLGALRFPRVVAATSEVLTPYTNQLVVNSTDLILYRYDGATWVASLPLGGTTSATRHEARYEQTTLQTIANVTDTKMKWNSAASTCDDVVASGVGNTDFALNRAGWWDITASMRFGGGAGGERYFTIVVAGDRKAAASGIATGGFAIVLSASTGLRVASGASVNVLAFHSNGANLNTDVGFGGQQSITFAWRHP